MNVQCQVSLTQIEHKTLILFLDADVEQSSSNLHT